MASEALNVSRRKLNEVLGEKSTKYFNHMKQWFRMKLTKEEFDAEARALLTIDQVHYHNEFLLALLNKVEGLAETSMTIAQEKANSQHRNSRRHKRNSRTSERSNFEPVDLLEYLPSNSPPGAGSDGVKYATQEIFLPDHALVVGRFMLAAWELGLEGADDEAADLIVVAVQHFLKNIISAVISQRKGYKTRNKHFKYDIGGDMPNMWLRNSNKLYDPQSEGRVGLDDSNDVLGPRCPPTIDEVEQSAVLEIACSSANSQPNEDRLTLDELYHTLLTHKNIIACHSVYAVNMERIAVMLNHPSY
ncbi:Transcriptional adapter 1 [Papilio machaon]|uniref:Transcriptional adapter 1 n=1 Tax=Papilio machaon TaxID=76193 RepID=A0A194RW40_PAPMA|nr:transcriptional adapter 1 isoform X1 [Papilio machaon]KPJ20406.1 Transcriptional adapter 1 [Papilio machaon]